MLQFYFGGQNILLYLFLNPEQLQDDYYYYLGYGQIPELILDWGISAY